MKKYSVQCFIIYALDPSLIETVFQVFMQGTKYFQRDCRKGEDSWTIFILLALKFG